MEPVTILAIESSCDETAAAVVRNGREVLSNVKYTKTFRDSSTVGKFVVRWGQTIVRLIATTKFIVRRL